MEHVEDEFRMTTAMEKWVHVGTLVLPMGIRFGCPWQVVGKGSFPEVNLSSFVVCMWSSISIWSNYSDLTRTHPKWWFSKGNPLNSGKSRLVKYYNLARSIEIRLHDGQNKMQGFGDTMCIYPLNIFLHAYIREDASVTAEVIQGLASVDGSKIS